MPGSFARRTLEVRVPKILEDTVAANRFDADVLRACLALHLELTGGRLRGLVEDTPDRAAWDAACAPHVGAPWLELPWYFAESFFYRRLLEATRFFDNGADPFLVIKQTEERAMLPRVLAARGVDDLDALVRLSLWSNRADLSYTAGRAFGDAGDVDDLLVDDRARAVPMLQEAHRVAIVLDNAGTELAFDLLLAVHLVRAGKEVTLHAKEHPYFVSDATIDDVLRTLDLLELGEGSLELTDEPHWTSSRFHTRADLPKDLARALANFDVVIMKGDANYRRLVRDAPWPHETPVEMAMDFPAPLVALRTCKAEVAVGVPIDVVTRARSRDEQWLVSGRFGMIQVAAAPSKPKGP